MRSRLLVAAVGVPALLYVVLWGPPLLMLAALAPLPHTIKTLQTLPLKSW